MAGPKTDKHITWLCSISLMGLMFPQFFWLGEGDLLLMSVFLFVIGIGGGNNQVVPTSMKADVIDLDAIESGEDRAGLFFAAWSTATKIVVALGVGISMPALGYLGFDPTVVNDAENLLSLRAWFCFCAGGFLPALGDACHWLSHHPRQACRNTGKARDAAIPARLNRYTRERLIPERQEAKVMRLNGLKCVVTGGSSGIGAATVRRFVAEGAEVLIATSPVDEANALGR